VSRSLLLNCLTAARTVGLASSYPAYPPPRGVLAALSPLFLKSPVRGELARPESLLRQGGNLKKLVILLNLKTQPFLTIPLLPLILLVSFLFLRPRKEEQGLASTVGFGFPISFRSLEKEPDFPIKMEHAPERPIHL